MGIVEFRPDVSDELIEGQKTFVSSVDRELVDHLRIVGFTGPRSELNRCTDPLRELVQFHCSAAMERCIITYWVGFSADWDSIPGFNTLAFYKNLNWSGEGQDDVSELSDSFIRFRESVVSDFAQVAESIFSLKALPITRPVSQIDKIESGLTNKHLAWLLRANGNMKLATECACLALPTLIANCQRIKRLLDRGAITEREFAARFLEDPVRDSCGDLIWGCDGFRLLELDETFAALPEDCQPILRRFEPFSESV